MDQTKQLLETKQASDPQVETNPKAVNESSINKIVKSKSIKEKRNESCADQSSYVPSIHSSNHTVNMSKFINASLWEGKQFDKTDCEQSLSEHPKNTTINKSMFEKSNWDASVLRNKKQASNENDQNEDLENNSQNCATDQSTCVTSTHPNNPAVNMSQFDKSSIWDKTQNAKNKTISRSLFDKTSEWELTEKKRLEKEFFNFFCN